MYDGGESLGIRRFLKKINDVANLGKWSNAEKVTILKLKLAGIAEEFFYPTQPTLFSSCIQGSSESVQEFAARINKLGTQIFHSSNTAQNTAVRNANDQLLQSRFISGLRNDIRRFVLARDPNNLEESINAALIEEQNVKLNQIANDERTGLSPLQTETSVISALTNKLEEINLRVERLQEASSVTARKTDFRKLNEITLTQDFVIPTLDDILHEISGSNYFSALDMKSAFNQIPLHFADRHKTAFSTPDGDKYEFNRLCFGLKNSPKAFQSIAQEVLGDLLHNGALVYIDDIILFTKTIDEHFELLGFLSNKNPSSKILRWKLALEEFNYDIHYIRGSLNSVADHLSRCINNITIALPESKDLIKMQHEDPVLSPIIQKIDQNDVSPQVSNYFINGEGLLCHLSKRPSRSPRSNTTRKQVCIPHCPKARILESIHSEYGGHLKFFKTYHRLSENFFWQNMYKDTKNFVRSCTVCLSRKNAFKIPPAPHQPVEQSQEPGETCHIDIFGPLKTTPKGNSYVLSMIDAFTKYIHIVPLPDIKSSTISKAFFDNYIVHRGCPHKLVVDNATYFKSSEFVEFCRVMGIHKRHISSYSAHVNGRVEKPNQSLANILASISQNTNDWDEQLPHTMLALNSAIHEATYTSPFFLEHGRDIRLSYTYEKNSDTPQNKYEYVEKLLPSLELIFNKVLKNLKEQEASHVDLSTRATKQHHYDYKIGSLCFIKTPNIKSNLSPKLRPKFEGPYRVIERFSNVNYRVQHVEQLRKRFNTHVNRMIPFIKRFSYLHLNNLDDLQNQTRRRLRVLFQVHGII
ncbi:transposon Tf2-8 polyprotein [Trichonephila clavipes]|nr:transposon Tf2-8 polyprotein [Trichonephila clavipes]